MSTYNGSYLIVNGTILNKEILIIDTDNYKFVTPNEYKLSKILGYKKAITKSKYNERINKDMKAIITKVGINAGALTIEGYYENQWNKALMTIQSFECENGKSPVQIIYVDEDKVILKVLMKTKPNKIDLDSEFNANVYIEVNSQGKVKLCNDWKLYWKE